MRSSHDKINNAKALRSLVGLVATEQLIHTPFVFLPCFYMTKEVVEGDGHVDAALTKWRRNIIPDMCADMVIWVPSNLVNFAFVPQHFRVPFVALTATATPTCAEDVKKSLKLKPSCECFQQSFNRPNLWSNSTIN